MKTINILAVFSTAFVTTAFAVESVPAIHIKRTIVLNGTADNASFNTSPATVGIGVTGANNVENFGTALPFQFLDNGNPVNVFA